MTVLKVARILNNTPAEKALLGAAKSNDPAAAAAILSGDGSADVQDIDSTEKPGQTTLYLFALKNNFEGLQLLCGPKRLSTQEANITLQDEDGKSVLHWAAQHGNEGMCEVLLQQPEINQLIDQVTTVASSNNVVSDGGSIASQSGLTALHLAAAQGSAGICNMLVQAKADLDIKTNVNAKETGNRTALHLAAEAGHEKVCKALIQHSAWSHALDQGGQTPLDLAKDEKTREEVQADYDQERSAVEQGICGLVCAAIADEPSAQKRLMRYPMIVVCLLVASVVPAVTDTVFDWVVTFELLGATAETSQRPEMDRYLGGVSLGIICTANLLTAGFIFWWECRHPEQARFNLRYFTNSDDRAMRLLLAISAGNLWLGVVGTCAGFACWILLNGQPRDSDLLWYWAVPGYWIGAVTAYTFYDFMRDLGHAEFLNNLPGPLTFAFAASPSLCLSLSLSLYCHPSHPQPPGRLLSISDKSTAPAHRRFGHLFHPFLGGPARRHPPTDVQGVVSGIHRGQRHGAHQGPGAGAGGDPPIFAQDVHRGISAPRGQGSP